MMATGMYQIISKENQSTLYRLCSKTFVCTDDENLSIVPKDLNEFQHLYVLIYMYTKQEATVIEKHTFPIGKGFRQSDKRVQWCPCRR